MSAKKTAKPGKTTMRYADFKRGWNGIVLACFMISTVASAIAGASMNTILYRGVVVCVILMVVGRIIIRSWASWEDLKKSGHRKRH